MGLQGGGGADTATLGAYSGNSDLVLLEEPGAAAQGETGLFFFAAGVQYMLRSWDFWDYDILADHQMHCVLTGSRFSRSVLSLWLVDCRCGCAASVVGPRLPG
jgi:hypothetical protein